MKKEVLEHYDTLADEFDSISNKYCNERYRRALERVIKPSDSVLEVGCGTGLLLSRLNARKKVGCDLSGRLLSQLKKRDFQVIQADAERLPLGDSRFDVVYSVNLLEHVPHPEKAVSESVRVLKKGGRLVIITPNGDWGLMLELADMLRLKAPEGPHHFLTSKALRRIVSKGSLKTLSSRKMVIVPSGPKFLKKMGESLEQKTGALGFFHLVVTEKI
jgi:ubiquinone/menaquinone biosynthesis C-methylase UbiE